MTKRRPCPSTATKPRTNPAKNSRGSRGAPGVPDGAEALEVRGARLLEELWALSEVTSSLRGPGSRACPVLQPQGPQSMHRGWLPTQADLTMLQRTQKRTEERKKRWTANLTLSSSHPARAARAHSYARRNTPPRCGPTSRFAMVVVEWSVPPFSPSVVCRVAFAG
jgi:hypothetical protein